MINHLSLQTGSSMLLAENPELAEALPKLDGVYVDDVVTKEVLETLTPGEWNQIYGWRFRVILNQQWQFSEARADVSLEQWRRLARQPSWRAIWELVKDELDPEYVDFMEHEVIDQLKPQP